MGWRDVGSWQSLHDALHEIGPTDGDGNVLQGDVETDDVRNCHIMADGRMVAAIGIEDLTVVVTDDVVLVAKSEAASRVGRIVEPLGQIGRASCRERVGRYV